METTRHNQSQPWSPLTIDPQFLGFIHNVDVSSLNILSRVTFRHKRKPPSITLDNLLQGMGSELFSKAVAKHQRTSTVSLNISERERKKKRKRGASPLIPAFSLVDVI